MTPKTMSESLLVAAGTGLVAFLATCGGRLGARMPQAVRGDDALSVAFGDAKETISRAMVHKADSYFHGGLDMECSEEGAHAHAAAHGAEEAAHGAEEAANAYAYARGDLWHWIDVRIRAPEIERHLEGAKAVEMMPWFWAAVKADPHNIDAWTTAIYTAAHVMGDAALTREVIAEAERANPESLEIRLSEGEFVYDRGRGDVAAARRIFEDIRARALSRRASAAGKLSESDRWMLTFAQNYLRKIGERADRP